MGIGKTRWLRPALWAALAIALGVALRALPAAEMLETFRAWAAARGVAGQVAFALVYALCVVLFVPASVLTLGAGAVYGLGPGLAVVLAGATLGSLLSFWLARGILRSRVEQWVAANPRVQALDRAVALSGARIVFLVRLSPIFPFTLSNYVFGLTGVSAGGYALATIVGMIPGSIAYVYLGLAGADAAVGGEIDAVQTMLQVLGAASALLVTLLVARLASRAIREAGVAGSD